MAVLLGKTRQVRIRRRKKEEAGKKIEESGRFCVICGNTNEKEIRPGYMNEDGNRIRVDICSVYLDCANLLRY